MEELLGVPMIWVSIECGNVRGETVDVMVGDLSAAVTQRRSGRGSGVEQKKAT